jgi:hypothetical protein
MIYALHILGGDEVHAKDVPSDSASEPHYIKKNWELELIIVKSDIAMCIH